MDNILYDFWAASLQDGYIGNLIQIVDRAEGSRQLYHMSENQLKGMGLTNRMIKHIINRRNSFNLEAEYDAAMKKGIHFVRYKDSDYPSRLRDIESAPFALFVVGSLPSDDIPAVAIVGARECSEYGRYMAEYFGTRLAQRGVNIVSGMAYGIDGIAQMSAIDSGGLSYAVLGCGVDVIYPAANRRLYERLAGGGGGIISEYAPGTKAISRNFPPRNRIISGLCDVLLVVEARAKSGTLITTDLAMDQGREVMIIPGRITDPLSVGCVNLMKAGASPALCVEDVMEHLPNVEKNGKEVSKKMSDRVKKSEDANMREKGNINLENPASLTAEERKVYDCLDFYPVNVNTVASEVSMNISRLLTVLTTMEMKGIVRSIGQGAFVKTS